MDWIYVTENKGWLGPRLGTVVGAIQGSGGHVRGSEGHVRGSGGTR